MTDQVIKPGQPYNPTEIELTILEALDGYRNYATGKQLKLCVPGGKFLVAMRRLEDARAIRVVDKNEKLEDAPWGGGSFTHSTWEVTDIGYGLLRERGLV